MKCYEINKEFDDLMFTLELLADFDDTDDVTEMKEALNKQIEELYHETEYKLENMGKLVKNMDLETEAYKTEIDRMSKRVKSLNNQKAYIKNNLIKPILERTGKQKAGVLTLSLRSSQAVRIYNEALIGSKYKTEVVDIVISKKKLKEDLKAGNVPGAELVENKSVQIK